jgi:hypothetical protein
MTDAPDRKRLRELAEKATPGTWESTGNDIWIDTREQVCCGNPRGGDAPWDEPVCCGEPDIVGGQEQVGSAGTDDAKFIAAANPAAILSLLDTIDRMEASQQWRTMESAKLIEGKRYLIWVDLHGLHVNDRSYARIAFWGPRGFTEGGSEYPIANVTHWLPLPPTPGKETQE